MLLLLLLRGEGECMELWLSLLLCRQGKTVEWWLSLLMMVVVLRPAVADVADMDRLWAHRCHLLGLSPWVDPGPDHVLFVLQCLGILVASALDALVAVLEDHAVFFEELDPSVVKLLVLVHVLNSRHQFFENRFMDFAYVVLLKTIPMVSPTTSAKGKGLAADALSLLELGTNLEVSNSCKSLAATRKVTDRSVLVLVDVFDVRLDVSPLLEQLPTHSALERLLVRVAAFVCLSGTVRYLYCEF